MYLNTRANCSYNTGFATVQQYLSSSDTINIYIFAMQICQMVSMRFLIPCL